MTPNDRCLAWSAASLAASAAFLIASPALGQNILFDFSNAPPFTSLPISLTMGGVTAQFTATGQGFSIQQASAMGFTPVGFSNLCIYPNSVFPADVNISFSKTITNFSILTAVQDLSCDNGATMKVTAYLNGTQVGFATAQAPPDFTWPSMTLAYASAGGFNSVNVHYYLPPPGCGDWGPIFMADNMNITPAPAPAGDLNGDYHVNAADLAILLGAWGTNNAASDLNHDGTVNASDLAVLLGAWTG